ncbi:hypothetical protein NGRA_2406 [Nosema granulosis]|uniref:Reverse transcriptase domain-containing protein n=1 Tax=Nosema granulosis TaxID=83296 RepID=A0A9P6GXR1_9MICR|nr:hypothetical protein NGRA_2406 [Nosema granulosis]
MSMFIRGLKYILPCQSRFGSRKPINDIITEQYQNISTIVKSCLNDNRVVIAPSRAKQAFSALERIVHESYSIPLSRRLGRRAQYECKTVRTIQRLLRQRPDIVIRRTDKSKVFYIGKADDFARKAEEYMVKTQAYEEITTGRCPLAENLHAVQTLLEYLATKNILTQKQCKRISPKLNKLELGHYHGLPKPHKVSVFSRLISIFSLYFLCFPLFQPGTPLRPIIASINAPATLISKFLNDLLAPIFLHVTRTTTFINGIDVVRTLEKYVADGHFKSTTKFITADVTDLYTMIPRQGALEALARFCLQHSVNGKIGTFTVDHIMRMARLILDTNTFAYNHKYYRQIRGGAMGSAFTQVLANIYMFEWEQDLIQQQTTRNEIYGRFVIHLIETNLISIEFVFFLFLNRYIDDIFMTTNQTVDEIRQELEQTATKDVNIKINYEINLSVAFLDVTITNEDSQLRTSIYHKPVAEPYILPYTSDHPRHIHQNIPYGALLRAVRICSNIHDFNSERIRLDVSLLLNGYPPNFITKQFHRLIHSNHGMPMLELMNEHDYHRIHQTLLHQPTRREQQLNKMSKDPIESPLVLQPSIWNSKVMYPQYLFDSGISTHLRRDFIEWWKEYYACPGSSVYDVKVRLVAKTHRTLESFFIHKKPPREMLTKME